MRKASKSSTQRTPWKPAAGGWMEHCRVMGLKVGHVTSESMMENIALPDADIDWLAVAIWRLGGPTKTAQATGVSRSMVHRWLIYGLRSANFENVVELAVKSRIPYTCLAERLGPYEPQSPRRKRNQ